MLTAILAGVAVAAVAYLIFYNTPGFGELGSATAAILLAVMAGTGYAWNQGMIGNSAPSAEANNKENPDKRPLKNVSSPSEVGGNMGIKESGREVKNCLNTENDKKRLRCYDRFVPKFVGSLINPEIPTPGENHETSDVRENCEIKNWTYNPLTEETFTIEGVTSCTNGYIRLRVKDARTGDLVTVTQTRIKGGSFKAITNARTPERVSLSYTVHSKR